MMNFRYSQTTLRVKESSNDDDGRRVFSARHRRFVPSSSGVGENDRVLTTTVSFAVSDI